jgi:amylosucrase
VRLTKPSRREIFPDDHPGSFVQLPDGRWIWSTFYHVRAAFTKSESSLTRPVPMGSQLLQPRGLPRHGEGAAVLGQLRR